MIPQTATILRIPGPFTAINLIIYFISPPEENPCRGPESPDSVFRTQYSGLSIPA
ncbi:hypothetical protein L21SP2_1166 [Salinispira pacifica]|uniref:Uncharacterized protein n=1 Tax=Salinispira pacifica TaxID=1307761 RepID=V5WGA1_9SPIO|nr:hypothetical protein L21SP2_1166 [Salinispira pacifica]